MVGQISVSQSLTANEQADYRRCKFRILNGLEDVARALEDVRNRRLYREEYATFEDFCRAELGKSRRQIDRVISASQINDNLRPIGLNPVVESVARVLAPLPPDEQREAYQQAVESVPDGRQPTAAQVSNVVEQRQSNLAVHYSSETPEWYTPSEIIQAVLQVLGQIDLDPCSNSKEMPNVPAVSHFTLAENGLEQPWYGRVYMNPPYGDEIGKWVNKLDDEYEAGRTQTAIALLPARTDTRWFARLYAFPLCFIQGRLKFSGHDNSAPFPSVVIYLGDDDDSFYDEFAKLGLVYAPARWK